MNSATTALLFYDYAYNDFTLSDLYTQGYHFISICHVIPVYLTDLTWHQFVNLS